ncbi:hypothetical protein, partial [Escherichia coli]|uniref:hypothetical protein n=1 Tax=Escherichia coli TaxID=562 RepID=UPI0025504E85
PTICNSAQRGSQASPVTDRVQATGNTRTCHAADGEKIMEILEKIEVSARLLAEIISVVLITNRQHKNSQFWGQKTGCFARFDVFSS